MSKARRWLVGVYDTCCLSTFTADSKLEYIFGKENDPISDPIDIRIRSANAPSTPHTFIEGIRVNRGLSGSAGWPFTMELMLRDSGVPSVKSRGTAVPECS